MNRKNTNECNRKGKGRWIVLLLLITVLTTMMVTTDQLAAKTSTTRAKKLTVTKKKSSMVVGESYTIKTAISPSNTRNKKLKFTSSNRKTASISSSGRIKAIKKGKTTISVRTTDGSRKSTKFTLKVVTGVSKIIASKSVAVNLGKTKNINYQIMPKSAVNKSVSFSTSNSKVASITSKGVVKGKKVGTAKIYVKTKDGSNKKATVYVAILNPNIKVTKIETSVNTQHMLVGDSEKIAVTITPSNASNKTVSYTSSNPGVATVYASGYIKAVASGSVTIQVNATDGSGKSAQVNYEVKKRSDVVLNSQQFISHRGLNTKAPQNTLPAFSLAAKYPTFMGIETDVYETYDGKFVLIHNDTVTSMTNGTGGVRSKTLAQLQKLKIDAGTNYSKYSNLKIPVLEDYLLICKAYNVTPVLHIKSISSLQKMMNILTQMDMLDKTIITGSKAYMLKFRALNSSVQLYWMCYMTNSGIDFAKAHNFNINTEYTYVTEDRVTYAHSKGLKVGVWTVDNKYTILKFINKGVDFVTTNYMQVPQGKEKIPTIPLLTPTFPK